jgi:hypothetical protein
MFSVDFDYKQFDDYRKHLVGAEDQMRFALSLALNEAGFNARRVLTESTWPSHVHVFNSGFIGYALRAIPSTKDDLEFVIMDAIDRGHLKMHAEGGTRTPRGAHLAIPITANTGRTAHGVPAAHKPLALVNAVLLNRPSGPAIFQRVRKGALKLMYVLKSAVQIKADVPFESDFEDVMRTEMRTNFVGALMRAMLTRR